jgi:hypothetical protein
MTHAGFVRNRGDRRLLHVEMQALAWLATASGVSAPDSAAAQSA